MKKKQRAFSIIELLVVVVIIGILATISVVSYGGFVDKAKDVAREVVVNYIDKYIKAQETKTGTYILSETNDATTFYNLLENQSEAFEKLGSDICFYYMAGVASGDAEEYAVFSYGKSRSTNNKRRAGIIYAGTPFMTSVLAAADFEEEDFNCALNGNQPFRSVFNEESTINFLNSLNGRVENGVFLVEAD